ncbi:MAG: hypothetical protein R3336_09545, partial [Phycisphaeraceae bacterium]|nr:hypothetical protein [Phycisphaeraceae bacterium]
APVYDRVVLQRLTTHLGLENEISVRAIRERAKAIESERRKLSGQGREAGKQMGRARHRIASTLKRRWPELSNPWHPDLGQVLEAEGEAILEAIDNHAQYNAFKKHARRVAEVKEQRNELQRQHSKCLRWLRTAENVVLAHNLKLAAEADVVAHYQRLVELESGSLGTAD